MNLAVELDIIQTMEELVRKGQVDGSIRRDIDPESAAYLISGVHAVAVRQLVLGMKDGSRMKKIERFLEFQLDAIREK